MTATNLEQEERMIRARSRLINKFPLIGILVLGLKLVEDTQFKTGWTNGISIGYNPDWISKMSLSRIVGFVAHEGAHVMFKHTLRRGNRDPKIWALATDLVINAYLKYQVKLQLPDNGWFDPKYMGSSAELIYKEIETIKKEADRKKQALKSKSDTAKKDNDNDDDKQSNKSSKKNSNKSKNNHGKKAKKDNKATKEGSDDSASKTKNSSNTRSGNSSDSNSSTNKTEKQKQKEKQEAAAKAIKKIFENGVDLDKLSSDKIDLKALLDQDDPGGCGAVKDYPVETPEDAEKVEKELEKAEEELDLIISQAQIAQDSKDGKGWSMSGGTTIRMVESLLSPKIPWKTELRDFFEQIVKNDYSWAIPNKRFGQTSFIVPSLYNREIGTFGIFIDASGSINQKEFTMFGTELTHILETFQQATLQVVFFDHFVRNNEIKEYTYNDLPIKLSTTGGGGTDFRPPFKRIEDEDVNPVGVVVFTDLECGSYPEEPDYPVLWVATKHQFDKYYNPPFGRIIYMDMA